jgi:Domain of unknown function (DUF4432)
VPELHGQRYTRAALHQLAGRLDQVAGVRLITLGDGSERGVRILEFRTGSGFAFDVLVDRAFDIGHCELGGRSLAWESAVGVAGPWYFEPEGLGFLRNFGGGLLTTGGLDHALFMAEDTAEQYHYPPKQKERYGLHGRISNRPATLRGYGSRWEGDECVLWARGEVLQAAVFGEQLLVRRTIEARVGESRLTVRDEVENVGHALTPHMLLYHVNVGWPVVDDGSELLLPAAAVVARDDQPVEGYRVLRAPQMDFVEQVFEHHLASEPDGRVPVCIVNRRLGIGVYQIFNSRQLPYHFVWRMLGAGTYVVGIEPCTNRVEGRLDARARGELIELAPSERRLYELELGALDGESQIEAFVSRITRLASDTQAPHDGSPPPAS